MSRHRDVRNLDYQAELDDDALSDGGEELTEEQELQMNQAFEAVREVIGDEVIDIIGEQAMREALWECYFDVAQTANWAMGKSFSHSAVESFQHFATEEIERKRRAEERKDEDDNFYGESPQAWSRLPKIMQAQPEGGYLDIDEPQMMYPNRLSTITEHTEKTEAQSMYTKPESTIRGRSRSDVPRDLTNQSIDPSTIPPSPTLSAIQRLSLYEGPPSNPPSLSRSSGLSPRQSLESVPAIEVIPDIPDFHSKSSKPPALPAKPQSKLSKRAASSRASSAVSSRSGAGPGTASMSVQTYPSLRPSSQSQLGRASEGSTPGSAVSKELPPVPPNYDLSYDQSSVRSSIVRDAIANAMRLEEMDKTETPKRSQESVPFQRGSLSVVSEKARSQVSVPQSLSDRQSQNPSPPNQPPSKPPSTVARSPSPPKQPTPKPIAPSTLSRAAPSASSATSTVSSLKTASSQRTVSTVKPLSKLALLAQQKADASRAPKLPEPKTEYLTPIANGSSVTTAITTSYQTLYSLTDPARSNIIPKLDVVPLEFRTGAPSPRSPPAISAGKASKLALKAKRAQEKLQAPQSPAPPSEPEYVAPVLPIFQPSPVHARASPSAFAQILVDESSVVSSVAIAPPPLDEPSWIGPDLRTQWQQAMAPTTISHKSSSTTIDSADSHPHRRRRKHNSTIPPPSASGSAKSFAFDSPSPDDIVLQARASTGLRKGTASSRSVTTATEKEKEKAAKLAAQKAQASMKAAGGSKKKATPATSGAATPVRQRTLDTQQLDIAGLNLQSNEASPVVEEPPPKLSMAREKVLEEARRGIQGAAGEGGKKAVSIVVIGHVDAGKSTLMGRLLYDLGRLDEKTKRANERGSANAGKGSFSWAWGLDGTLEERHRGITMDIALQILSTPNRQITVLDAPGHKDFIPNMISGASQADCALLVIDSTVGEFESGFERGGQTREHLLLVRSLGVSQVIVAVNKLDAVNWSQARYEEIKDQIKPFLVQSGFHPSKTSFVPVGAMQGVNLLALDMPEAGDLRQWYKGPALVSLLDKLEPPTRDIDSPLRLPLANVFKGQGQGAAVSGRIITGIVQVGEKLRVLPGDETGVVKSIEVDEENVPWAAAGSNVNIQLTAIDPVNLIIGSVLCPLDSLVPLATSFLARVIVFDIQVPITTGASIEVYHHSRDVPATATKLLATLDRANGKVIKANPRVITKGTSAELQLTLRSTSVSGAPSVVRGIPMEPFSVNKDMGRILIRRGGETIAAGIVLEIIN